MTNIIKGYKATDKNIKCRGFQFEPGKWHKCEGELELCGNGFHFCEQPSGPWSYYSDEGTRIFKCEAKEVLETPWQAGADRKLVARHIRLVEEVIVGGDCNTGDRNTGYCNTGDRNTGNRNTGDGNTGNHNTGYRNTGDGNTGSRNTGYRNTGDGNTGSRNTGQRNTGNCNTGDWNATNYSSGFFCLQEPPVICFDVNTNLTRKEFDYMYGRLSTMLGSALSRDGEIDFDNYAELPGITKEKLKALHDKFITVRKEQL